jgi:hypothetical protein
VRRITAVTVAARRPRRGRTGIVGDDLQSAVSHASRRQDALCETLELVAPPAEHDDLEAAIMVQVNVKRRPNLIPQIVLELGQLLGELAHVVVVDERQRRDGRQPATHARTDHLGPHEIA